MEFRLVELHRLRFRTKLKEALGGKKDPDRVEKFSYESKGGVKEIYIRICDECGEEYCYGGCIKYQYEDNKRKINDPDVM